MKKKKKQPRKLPSSNLYIYHMLEGLYAGWHGLSIKTDLSCFLFLS